jgi:hypothetical protein
MIKSFRKLDNLRRPVYYLETEKLPDLIAVGKKTFRLRKFFFAATAYAAILLIRTYLRQAV